MWNNFKSEFSDWATQPFAEDMPASHWFLLIGFVIVCIVLWNIILTHLFDAIRGAT